MAERTWQEEFKLAGEDVLSKLKELLHEGNITRIILKNEDDKVIMEVPFNVALVGVVLAPILAAIGAAAAVMSKCKLIVEKRE